ncbi:MAG: KilA-N domain-containing protein, partial [Clostridia bacterium]|nr:KilA-N domain-containing protein [Clostridia bacterium]
MDKSAIQNQLQYIIAKEQYMKPLLENEIITEEVYNEVLENLYDEFEVWRYNRIQNPGIEFRKKKRESKRNLAEQNPGYISLTELARSKPQKSTGYTIQMWLRDSCTVDFLTLWENKHNEKFLSIPVELKALTPKIWIKETHSIGIVSRQGKNGGTYAHKEIALHFMCWLSAEMMLNV